MRELPTRHYKIWLTKHGSRPVFDKMTISTKKVLNCILFSSIVIQIKVPKGKSVTNWYNRDVILLELKEYYQNDVSVVI